MTKKRTIRYGNGELTLLESEQLIAVAARPAASEMLELELEALRGSSEGRQPAALGGYALVPIEGDAEAALQRLGRLPWVAGVSRVYHTSDDEVPFVPTGEIHIGFDPELPTSLQGDLMIDHGLQLVASREDGSLVVTTTSSSPDPITAVESLQESEGVLFAEPDLATPLRLRELAHALEDGSDLLRDQWHLKNTGHHCGTSLFFKPQADARIVEAWRAAGSFGSPEVVVAQIDRGFDLADPGLLPRLVANARGGHAGAGADALEPAHGTASARAAVGCPAGGTFGVAPEASLLPVACGAVLSDREVESWLHSAIRGGAWVIGCGWGAAARYFPLSRRKYEAIRRCSLEGRNGKGCAVVFAAGNEKRDIAQPQTMSLDGFATHPDVIAVAASNSRDLRAHYSNFGREVWICAPSNGAAGAGVPPAETSGGKAPGGTSFACALVTGVIALLLSVNPKLSPFDVKTILRCTARQIGDGYNKAGHSRHFGYGCVDAEKAVNTACGYNVVAPWAGGAAM